MEQTSKKPTLKMIFLATIIVVIILGAYAVLTYPQTVVDFPVSFTIGANVEEQEFSISPLQGKVQVEIAINSGSVLWSATIADQNQTIWEHRTTQGEQTTYQSSWIDLPSGLYNFTFSTAGFGDLNANVKVVAKGGFW